MGWKNWPYWLKGGMIGLLIGIIVSIILFFINCERLFNCKAGSCGNPLFCVQNIFIYIILGLLIGSIIGWIYGKIKSRRQKRR